jgi:hypothetical protein
MLSTRPKRHGHRWGHLSGRIIFPAEYPNGVEIDQQGHPILDDNGNPLLSIDLPDPDLMEIVVDPVLLEQLHPEERTEQKIWKHHQKTMEYNTMAYGRLLDDEEWVLSTSGDEDPEEDDEYGEEGDEKDDDTMDSSDDDTADGVDLVDSLENAIDDVIAEDLEVFTDHEDDSDLDELIEMI